MELSCRQRNCTQSGPCISWESVCGQCRGRILVCEVLFLSTLLQIITNITSENVTQIGTKECKIRPFFCKVNLNFLRSSRHFNCDTIFAVIVCFMNESVHGFNNVRNGRVNTRFQIVRFWRLWKFLVKNYKFSFRNVLVDWWVGYFWNCNLPLTFQIQLLWWKVCKRAQCIGWK